MTPQGTLEGRLRRLASATRCSLAGLRHALRSERAFQEEVLLLAVVVIPGALLLGRTPVNRALMVGSWLLVLVAELLNTALERTVDRIGGEPHELARQAKDLGSAAVAVSIVLALAVWVLVLFR